MNWCLKLGSFVRALVASGTSDCALAPVVILAFALSAHAQTLYQVTDLGDLPGGNDLSNAYGLNESGHVIGRSMASTGERAFLWTPEIGMENLGDLPGGDDLSSAADINDGGQIVGYSRIASGHFAFLWTRDDGMQALNLPEGSTDAFAAGINNSGHVVGHTTGGAFLWTPKGGTQGLGQGPGSSAALAINSQGHVVGYSTTPTGAPAFVWGRIAGIRHLGDLPGGRESGAGYGINNHDVVVGESDSAAGRHAFRWTSTTSMQDLGVLPGHVYSRAYGINDNGDIVGISGNLSSRAFVWTANGGIQDINGLLVSRSAGWVLIEATGINESGQIIGSGINPAGEEHGFILTPVFTSQIAFTEFDEPALGAGLFRPGTSDDELGFATMSSGSGGQTPFVGVASLDGVPATRVLTHRSLNATTTFDALNLIGTEDVRVSVGLQVANTTYEAGNFLRVFVTNNIDSINFVELTGTAGADGLDDLAGDGFVQFSAVIPNDWTQAALVIASSTNSSQAAERFDFDSIEFRGVTVIPEPGTWGLALAALAIVFWLRVGPARSGLRHLTSTFRRARARPAAGTY